VHDIRADSSALRKFLQCAVEHASTTSCPPVTRRRKASGTCLTKAVPCGAGLFRDRLFAPWEVAKILAGLRGLCQDIGEENGTIEMAAKLTSTIIQAAIDGFEGQKKNTDAQIAELRAMLTGAPDVEEQLPTKGTRRKFSAAARKRMREAQQLRWAKIKDESSNSAKTAVKAGKPKRGITAAGRKALSIAMKKRWAAKKAVA
jgi:hypothetical protein